MLSIIIPVYNGERSLGKCIESILYQTYGNFELILVNDGSKDRSLEICREYAAKDNRINVITQENSGASTARNKGIEAANGEWITFIDADDYVDPGYLEQLYKNITEEECTLIIQGLKQHHNENCINRIEFEEFLLTGTDIQKAFDDKEIFEYGYTVAKLYNRNIVSRFNIRFNEQIAYSEDMLFMLDYILHCNTIIFASGSNYNYIMQASDLSQRYNSFESEYLLFTEYIKKSQAIANKWGFVPSYKSLRCGALMLMRSIYSLYKNDVDKKERIKTVKEIRTKHRQYISQYYTPKIPLLKFAKMLFLVHSNIFDIFCHYKFNKKK